MTGPSGAGAGSRESELLDGLTEWIRRHHRQGGDFSGAAISAAGEAGLDALRCGYSLEEAFEAGRSAYFMVLGHVGNDSLAI